MWLSSAAVAQEHRRLARRLAPIVKPTADHPGVVADRLGSGDVPRGLSDLGGQTRHVGAVEADRGELALASLADVFRRAKAKCRGQSVGQLVADEHLPAGLDESHQCGNRLGAEPRVVGQHGNAAIAQDAPPERRLVDPIGLDPQFGQHARKAIGRLGRRGQLGVVAASRPLGHDQGDVVGDGREPADP